jgi:hypothetical protein
MSDNERGYTSEDLSVARADCPSDIHKLPLADPVRCFCCEHAARLLAQQRAERNAWWQRIVADRNRMESETLAECSRLRAALQEIARARHPYHDVSIARRALEEE